MSSDEVRDVIATLREVPRYVVRNDALTSRAVVGFDKWKGTTDVVLHADHLTAMQEKDRRHAEALAEAEQRHPGIPIQGEHYPLCFPAIRDVRIGDWGPSCFTCQVIGMVRAEALRQAREAVEAAKPQDFPCVERDDYSTAWEYAQDCMGAAIDALKGES